MKIQVNSDKTIAVDAILTAFVEGEVSRALDRFASKLTRVEVHLSDIDNKRTGRADKRCLIEVRSAGDRPMSATATAAQTDATVRVALGKVKRLLTTFFARKGRAVGDVAAPLSEARRTMSRKASRSAKKTPAVKKAVSKKPTKASARGPKKRISKVRRESSSTS